jgi:hypothetical protein
MQGYYYLGKPSGPDRNNFDAVDVLIQQMQTQQEGVRPEFIVQAWSHATGVSSGEDKLRRLIPVSLMDQKVT